MKKGYIKQGKPMGSLIAKGYTPKQRKNKGTPGEAGTRIHDKQPNPQRNRIEV